MVEAVWRAWRRRHLVDDGLHLLAVDAGLVHEEILHHPSEDRVAHEVRAADEAGWALHAGAGEVDLPRRDGDLVPEDEGGVLGHVVEDGDVDPLAGREGQVDRQPLPRLREGLVAPPHLVRHAVGERQDDVVGGGARRRRVAVAAEVEDPIPVVGRRVATPRLLRLRPHSHRGRVPALALHPEEDREALLLHVVQLAVVLGEHLQSLLLHLVLRPPVNGDLRGVNKNCAV